jgi:hypothetical protein
MRMPLPICLDHPHPTSPARGPNWRGHLRAEDLSAVLAALGAGDDADAVPVHAVEQALLSDAGDDDAEASARWCLEVLATLEPRPRPAEEPPWPVWHGVGAGGVVHRRPAPRTPSRGLLPSLGVGTHQCGQVTFIATTSFVQLIAPEDVVARLETRCGASFAAARKPELDPGPAERAAWQAVGLEAPVAFWWPPDACPLLARVWAAWVWQPAARSCALLAWPDGVSIEAPAVARYGVGLPDATEDARLTGAIRRVLGLVGGGGRPPGSALERRFPTATAFRRAYRRYAREFIADVGRAPTQADFADFLGVSADSVQRYLKTHGLSWPPGGEGEGL